MWAIRLCSIGTSDVRHLRYFWVSREKRNNLDNYYAFLLKSFVEKKNILIGEKTISDSSIALRKKHLLLFS